MQEEGAHLSSLDERAYRELRDMIVEGVLQPGEQLVQEALAERLGLSRTPLRKAIATLAQEGFVEITSRGVAYVRSFSHEELISIWEIRAVLEGLVCRHAARRAKPQHVAYLRSLITSAVEQVTGDDWTPYREADREFHSYIPSVVDDPLLTRILDAYQILSISLAQGLLRPPSETLPEHLEVLDAIEQRDPDRAERAMVHHIRTSILHLRSGSGRDGADALPDGFVTAAEEVLSELVEAIGETALAARVDGEEAVVIAAREPERMLRVACAQGARFPLQTTAAGKILLASLDDAAEAVDQVRELGHAEEAEEHEEGVAGLAVPIRHRGAVVAALSVLVPAGRLAPARDRLLARMQEASDAISRAIGS